MADEKNNPEGSAPRRKRSVTAENLETPVTNDINLPPAATTRRTTVKKAAPKTKAASASRPKSAKPAEVEQITPVAASSAPVPGPVVVDSGEGVAEVFVRRELIRARRNLRYTQVVGTVITLIGAVSLFSITNGFASNLQPSSAANIAQGMISDHLDDEIPQIQQQIREQVPAEIAKVPDYAKSQLPKYRETLEKQLEKSIQAYAAQTEPQLSTQVDSFLANNKEAVRAMVENGDNTQDTSELGQNMKQMFVDYLNTTTFGGETLKSKIDSALVDLDSIDARVAKMAANKNLTDNEKRGRRAIAILLRSVDENPQLKQAAQMIQNIDTTPVAGALQWKSQDEAVFTAPGKAPMVFVRKKDAVPAKAPAKGPSPAQKSAKALVPTKK